MAPRILQVPKKDIPPAWLGSKEQNTAPDVVFRISIEEIKQPPRGVRKKYPEDVKKLVREAMEEADSEDYTKEHAVDDFFELQKELTEHIEKQQQQQ